MNPFLLLYSIHLVKEQEKNGLKTTALAQKLFTTFIVDFRKKLPYILLGGFYRR